MVSAMMCACMQREETQLQRRRISKPSRINRNKYIEKKKTPASSIRSYEDSADAIDGSTRSCIAWH